MKVTGTYESVIGGVSELPPSSRIPGQCGEQVNFLSDRTVGLARRHGSVFLGERSVGGQPSASHEDGANWRVVPWQQAGGDYSALVRSKARTPGCTLPGLQVFSHATDSFLPIVRGVDADLDVLFEGGCSSAASTGAYLFMAGNNTVPRATSTDSIVNAAFEDRSAVWVRGGAFDRTYQVRVRSGGVWKEVTYRTPSASYPGVLDTSAVPWSISDGTGGFDNKELPITVVPVAAAATLTLLVWASEAEGTADISNLKVTNQFGELLTFVGDAVITSPLQYGGNPSISQRLRLHPSTAGETFNVSYSIQILYGDFNMPVQECRDTQVAAAQAEGAGIAYVTYPLYSPISIPGYTQAYVQEALLPGQFFYSIASPNYIHFHNDAVGQALLVSARVAKTVANPDYQRLVDDVKLSYDRAVTSYTLAAAAKIAPDAIALGLASALTLAGIPSVAFANHIALTLADEVTVSDGGDGSLIRGVDTTVPSIDALTDRHFVGKVVRILPASGADGYYVKATAKDAGAQGFTEVLWVEAAGVVHKIQHAFCYATISAGVCYVASSAEALSALLPGEHPDFPASTAGDSVTAPPPAFIGKKITLLTTFQNRLIVGTGGTLSISRTGDYLAFHPKSVLTVPADDAFEVTAQGSDTDVLRQSVLYGRDLLLFGDNRQYAISGKEALTPTGVSLSVVSTVPGAATCQPQAIGGYLFFANTGERGTAVSQLQPSLDPNNPQVLPVSEYLTSYLAGSPVEAARRGNPDTLYLRTDGAQGSIFQYRFSDSQRGREHSAWSKWQFHPTLGTVLGMRATALGLVVFFLRDAHGDTFLVADRCGEQAALSTRPYLDSQRPLAHVLTGTGSVRVSSPDSWVAAYTSASVRFLIGDALSGLPMLRTLYGDANLVVGAEQPARWEITSPYIRDKAGRVNLSGRLTVASVKVSAAHSSGMEATLRTPHGDSTRGFLARRAGDTTLIGRIPVIDWTQQLAVGKNNEGYSLIVSPKKWYPLTITGVEWVGQLFSRAQRV